QFKEILAPLGIKRSIKKERRA
mgnify:CR=1